MTDNNDPNVPTPKYAENLPRPNYTETAVYVMAFIAPKDGGEAMSYDVAVKALTDQFNMCFNEGVGALWVTQQESKA